MTSSSERLDTLAGLGQERVLEYYPHCTFAYMSGSVIEGFGNASSDVDVYVIDDTDPDERAGDDQRSTHEIELDESSVTIEFTEQGVLDFELWRPSTVERLVQSISKVDEADRYTIWDLSDSELTFLHRLRIGRPVSGEDAFTRLQQSVNWQQLCVALYVRSTYGYNSFSEDAVGAIQDGDATTAMLASRLTLEAAVDQLSASFGSSNNKPKWRGRRLTGLGLHDDHSAFVEAQLDTSPNEKDILASARRRLSVANDFVLKASRQHLASTDAFPR